MGNLWSREVFSIDADEIVTVSSAAADHRDDTQEGTYQLSESGDEILFEFPTMATIVQSGSQSYFETHLFSIEDDSILIDGGRYYHEK